MDTAEGNLAQATLPEHHSLIYFNYQGIRKDGVKKKIQIIYCIPNPNTDKCRDCRYKNDCRMEIGNLELGRGKKAYL